MDQTTNPTPAPPPPAQAPVPPTCPKCGSSWIAIIIAAILGAAIAGLLVYIVVTKVFMFTPPTIGGCEDKLVMAEASLDECELQVTEVEEENEELLVQVEEVEVEEPADKIPDVYLAWSTYEDSRYGLKWRYPAGWFVRENVITDDGSGLYGKNGFCVKFYDNQAQPEAGTFLSVCYREQTDSSASTWFRSGFGYEEMGKTNIQVNLDGTIITEKTLFGEDGNVYDIVYAQNAADDETGLLARVASGDYYFTMMAGNVTQGLSASDQEDIEAIIGSLNIE
jgi:hypothetical protein